MESESGDGARGQGSYKSSKQVLLLCVPLLLGGQGLCPGSGRCQGILPSLPGGGNKCSCKPKSVFVKKYLLYLQVLMVLELIVV